MVDEGDDEDGSIGPPPRVSARGGGAHTTPRRPSPSRASVKLWSSEGGQDGAGFTCVQDLARRVLYAKLETENGYDEEDEVFKSATTTLLDVAEALQCRTITLGLSEEQAACSELVCSLLYIGFQVGLSRKSPLDDTVLLLDFDLGLPDVYDQLSRDAPSTSKSDCSTFAEEQSLGHLDIDSD